METNETGPGTILKRVRECYEGCEAANITRPENLAKLIDEVTLAWALLPTTRDQERLRAALRACLGDESGEEWGKRVGRIFDGKGDE